MALKAYIGIKFHQDARNRHTIDLISEALNSAGFETVCIHRDVELFGEVQLTPKDLMAQTFDIICSCQLVVIELTEKGVGLGIEAGYAYARDIPVVTVAHQGADISNTLRGISREIYSYNDAEGLRSLFKSLADELSVRSQKGSQAGYEGYLASAAITGSFWSLAQRSTS